MFAVAVGWFLVCGLCSLMGGLWFWVGGFGGGCGFVVLWCSQV